MARAVLPRARRTDADSCKKRAGEKRTVCSTQQPAASGQGEELFAVPKLYGESVECRTTVFTPPPLPQPPRASTVTGSNCFGVSLGSPQPLLPLRPPGGRGQEVCLPRVFVECVHHLRERVQCPGLFRKTGSVTRQRAMRVNKFTHLYFLPPSLLPPSPSLSHTLPLSLSLLSPSLPFSLISLQSSLESGGSLSSPNTHDVASILKQFLRELPTPLLPSSLLPSLEECYSRLEGRERVEVTMIILLLLPDTHIQVSTGCWWLSFLYITPMLVSLSLSPTAPSSSSLILPPFLPPTSLLPPSDRKSVV